LLVLTGWNRTDIQAWFVPSNEARQQLLGNGLALFVRLDVFAILFDMAIPVNEL
jgi:hypothetical protein